jgi:hypothetical protein
MAMPLVSMCYEFLRGSIEDSDFVAHELAASRVIESVRTRENLLGPVSP